MTRSTIHTAMAYYLSLALLTTTTLAAPSWEPNHKYDYHLPGREYRTAAFHIPDEIQQHLPKGLNNHLPYFSDSSSFNIQHLSSSAAQAQLAPLRPSSKSALNFISILLLVTAFLLVAVVVSRLVRAVRRRRFFASKAKATDTSIYKEKDEQDYVLSLFVEKPKLRLSPPAPGSPVAEQEVDVDTPLAGRDTGFDLGRDSPV